MLALTPETIHVAAAAAIAFMVGIIAFMDWVPTPLNRNIEGMTARERLPSTLIHGAIGLGMATLNAFAVRWGILAGAVWFSVVLVAAIRNWWIPYFAAKYPGEITPEIAAKRYGRNVRVLPAFRGHPVIPDVQHTLIHLAIVTAVLLSFWSFASTW